MSILEMYFFVGLLFGLASFQMGEYDESQGPNSNTVSRRNCFKNEAQEASSLCSNCTRWKELAYCNCSQENFLNCACKRQRCQKRMENFTREELKSLRSKKFSRKWLSNSIKCILCFVKSSDCNSSFANSTENSSVVVNSTKLHRLRHWRPKGILRPTKSLATLCRNRPDCSIKEINIVFKNIPLDVSRLFKSRPLARSEIIVLDYLVNGTLVSKLEENEKVHLNFSKSVTNLKGKTVHCLFLDCNSEWSEEGMSVHAIYEHHVECSSDHLSSFTMVILDAEVSESNELALNLINYIGFGLSLAALLFTSVIYTVLHNDLQILTSTRHLVHLNLQIALALTQIFFLFGGIAIRNQAACKAVAILLHYFSLTGFSWILVETVTLYCKLILVYPGEFLRMKKFLLFGWGFPSLLVGLSSGLKIDAYGTEQWCWLSYKDGFSWVIFTPVIIITSVSTVTVIAVACVVFRILKSGRAGTGKGLISAARGVVILFPTLGLSWGFGVIAVNDDALVWKYLFAIFTSLQGFFVFLIYGVCNSEIREAVTRKIHNEFRSSTCET